MSSRTRFTGFDLSDRERADLVRYRHSLRRDLGHERWPYDDRLTEPHHAGAEPSGYDPRYLAPRMECTVMPGRRASALARARHCGRMRYDWGDRLYSGVITAFVIGLVGIIPAGIIAAVVAEETGDDLIAFLLANLLFIAPGFVLGFLAPGLVARRLQDDAARSRRIADGHGDGPDDDGGPDLDGGH